MKTKLSLLLIFISFFTALAQAPTIEGDTVLCPNATGTASIVTDQVYDSYTWYYKYWFTESPFVAIEGVNGPSFTYDWLTYDQALIKVVVTLDGQTYESNTLQIDSYVWSGLIVGYDDSPNVSYNPDSGNVMLCQGTNFTIRTYPPYTTNIRWYRNGELIENENSMELHIDQAGVYHVEASPEMCPDNVSSNEGLPINVAIDTDCDLGIEPAAEESLAVYPNPASDFITLDSGTIYINKIKIYNMAGQVVLSKDAAGTSSQVSLQGLSSGLYILEAASESGLLKQKIVKL